ncbi:YuzD family protein [Mesobacillus foraminis]|uniref:Disulfide oxidoreductase YuzD n=1 Tax=Mesobacillus foraminis TaxID=279826 RepID=A0A4R2B3W7_9BACI|nr:YuzD family protein [Mesobacillus foraminis]TCN21327.1 disulfide oxidoreductase YuzD [Mesobacillus foraminis]
MSNKQVELVVYGAEQLCPSCVNLPSSKETFEWLEAAISRKFKDQPFTITYVDIHNPPSDEPSKCKFAQRVIEEGMFYPVVLLDDRIVGEGNPRLKTIFAEMEKYGYSQE